MARRDHPRLTGDGKRIRRKVSGTTKAAVIDKLRDLHAQLDKGVTPKAGYAHYTVRQAAQDWLAHGLEGRSPKTVTKNQNVLEPILAVIGARKLRDLTAADVRKALAAMAAGYSTAAVTMGHLALKRAIRHAEANDLISRNVATLADTPKGQHGRPSKSLTLDQAVAVITAARTLPVMELRPGLKDVRRPATGSGLALGRWLGRCRSWLDVGPVSGLPGCEAPAVEPSDELLSVGDSSSGQLVEQALGLGLFHRRADIGDAVGGERPVQFLYGGALRGVRDVGAGGRAADLSHCGQEAVVGVDHQNPGRPAQHPEGVGDAGRELHPCPGSGLPYVVAAVEHHAAIEDVEAVVEGGVQVRWRGGALGQDGLGHRDRRARLGQHVNQHPQEQPPPRARSPWHVRLPRAAAGTCTRRSSTRLVPGARRTAPGSGHAMSGRWPARSSRCS